MSIQLWFCLKMKDLKIGGNNLVAIKPRQNCPQLFAVTELEATLWKPGYQREQLLPITSYWRGLLSCQDSWRKAIKKKKSYDKLLPLERKIEKINPHKIALLKSKHPLEMCQVHKYFHKEDLCDPKTNFKKQERKRDKQTNKQTKWQTLI